MADYLIEFSNTKSIENDLKDKDILESQRLRREVLPPMWDVYEKSISEKENLSFGKNISVRFNFGEFYCVNRYSSFS